VKNENGKTWMSLGRETVWRGRRGLTKDEGGKFIYNNSHKIKELAS